MMRKLFLATLGISTSLLAITPEQQVELDRIFAEQKAKIESQNLNSQSKDMALRLLENQKKEIEARSNEEIADYLTNGLESAEKNNQDEMLENDENVAEDESPLIDENTLIRSDGWLGWLFGATGARYSGFLGGKLGGAMLYYVTIGPQYNFSDKGSSIFTHDGFSLSIPIGFGAINTSGAKNDVDFALPIALEAKYALNSGFYRFGFSAGLRYTYSPQDIGDLHVMDFYAGLDLVAGAYIEAGYVFYSSQDIKLGKRTISTDPLSGAVTLNVGFRF